MPIEREDLPLTGTGELDPKPSQRIGLGKRLISLLRRLVNSPPQSESTGVIRGDLYREDFPLPGTGELDKSYKWSPPRKNSPSDIEFDR